MSENTARQWLQQASATVTARDFAAHMDVISRRVSPQGVPGVDNIGYDGWSARCKHEFDNQLIKSMRA